MSAQKNYKASVNSNGALYLGNLPFGMYYRWFAFPPNQFYRALDVSNNGEILIALSSMKTDISTMVYLIDSAGKIIWENRFFNPSCNNNAFEVRFVNQLDKFLIYDSKKLHCFKIIRDKGY